MKFLARFLVKAAIFIGSFFSRRMMRLSGAWLGFLWFDVFGFRKKIVLDNLKIAFPEWSEEQRMKVGRASVYNLGYNFGDFFFIPSMNSKWVQDHVVIEGWEHVEEARSRNKGMFLLSLHLGNGDVAANVISLRGQEVYIITKTFKTEWFNDLWFSIRGKQGVKYIDAHGPSNAFDILKALKKNAAVTFVLDQYMGRPYGIATNFFGKRTGTAYGLALFAQKTKAPVLPTYTFEGADEKLHIVFQPAMDLQPFVVEDKDQTLTGLTQAFNDRLESIIRQHPEQWMWVHRRWKDF
jgi:KDO2-lipid IV(A) lauroyltransferase